MANRLSKESSPYLLQHADNPVDWHPWGKEAFDRAKAEKKPLFVSIGYSSCHWCHVMEAESFENPEIAAVMNEHFINVKVDREERPDVDHIYMQAVQAITGSGGWPLNVFLTPEGKPFYGGTYFPPVDRGGLPSLPKILLTVADAYRDKQQEILNSSQKLTTYIQEAAQARPSKGLLSGEIIVAAYSTLVAQFDTAQGGFGSAPKFPQPLIHELLLRYYNQSHEERALAMVDLTLEKMAEGGMYDQIGGGFHRYSTDEHWLIPHFEKMLYDNALLAQLYLHAFQVTERPLYRRIVEETLDYVLRDLTDSGGAFYSSEDADSKGGEGSFYVWAIDEIHSSLPKGEADAIIQHFGMSQGGNFEGKNIPYVSREVGEAIVDGQLDGLIERGKAQLLKLRASRSRPARDEKIITSWNGLMIEALARAGASLGRDDYQQAAIAAATFLLKELQSDGRLLRVHKDGVSKLNGYLEDYAFLGRGLLALHEATLEARWLREARSLTDRMIELFWDEGEGIFYDTGSDHEELVIRPRDVFDHATPCGSSVATELLLKMAVINGNDDYSRRAIASLNSMGESLTKLPASFGNWIAALDFNLATIKEVVIIGDASQEATRKLSSAVYKGYRPNMILLGGQFDASATGIPLLKGREMIRGQPTAYLCENYSCKQPTTSAAELATQLGDR